jgi:hypothetical protein
MKRARLVLAGIDAGHHGVYFTTQNVLDTENYLHRAYR